MKGNVIISGLTYKKKTSFLMNATLAYISTETPFVYIEEGEITTALSGKITKPSIRGKVGSIHAKITAYKGTKIYDSTYTYDGKGESGKYCHLTRGDYFLFLESGTYDIRIESESVNRTIKNYQVKDGIKLYRKRFFSGQVKSKYPEDNTIQESKSINNIVTFQSFDEDIPEFNEALVMGVIRDQYGMPVKNAELIIADSVSKEVKTFVRTEEDGKFSFILGLGNYDIILRSPDHNAKIIRGYDFNNFEGGFLLDLFDNDNNYFKRGGSWLWISN